MRPLTAVDAEAMANIHSASFDRGWPALDMAVHIKTDICYGLGDPLRSFIIIKVAADQAEILTIATHPDHRGKGLAAQLLSQTLTELTSQNIREIFLEVAEDNVPAQALYKAAGFIPMGRRPAYYRRENGRVAALTFSKRLDGAKGTR